MLNENKRTKFELDAENIEKKIKALKARRKQLLDQDKAHKKHIQNKRIYLFGRAAEDPRLKAQMLEYLDKIITNVKDRQVLGLEKLPTDTGNSGSPNFRS